ncbi:cbb3-type cytochrome oxidase subunit 3 [Dyella soli]|uniref:Cbb3-type cytochrome c oxidase subunit 3 n=1 Tax=Dyella soli TaxID=522319 RepID=A0A4R0YT82_9GAMM|nr:cbb3-type cytochrome c oxidase subunit 3 [Dyella soli]TCI10053.1 cbb3-type cytochrome c oxidase subunit 3 [Dyella soli]
MNDVWVDFWGHLTGVIIVVMMVAFVSIWAWAWSGRHKRAFSRMAELPMEDEPPHEHAAAQACAKDDQP